VTTVVRIGTVAVGYVGAFLVASMAVAIRVANTSGPDAQAASGMYAFGDSYLFVAVFGLLALLPTGAALYFLRPYRRVWTVLSALALSIAITGVLAAVLFALGRREVAPSTLGEWGGFSVLRILLAPIFAPAFLVVALFAPHRSPRFALLTATVMELTVVAFAGVVWFVPLFFEQS
jgi:hypothetical protein